MPVSPRRHGDDINDEDDGDLNKTLGVQSFQQILSPAPRLPAEQHRTFNQEDLEGKNKPSASSSRRKLPLSWRHFLHVTHEINLIAQYTFHLMRDEFFKISKKDVHFVNI